MFINQTESKTMNEPNDEYDTQQRQSQQFYSRLFENGRFHKSHIEILAFFKSNYKYKRRNYTTPNKPKTAESTQVDERINKIYVAGDEDTSCCCHQKEEEKNITQKLKTKSDNFLLKSINLSLVVVFIVASFLYHTLKILSLSLIPLLSDFVQLTANSSSSSSGVTNQNITTNDDISLLNDDDDGDDNKDNVANTNEVNRVDFVTEDDDIDGDNFVTTSDNNNDDVNDDSDETCCQQNYDKLSTLGCQQQQQQQQKQKQQHHHNEWLRHQWISLLGRGSASSPTPSPSPFLLSVVIHTQVMSIFMTLFIALALLSVRCVEGGACWQKTLSSGKCDEIFSLNITKAECCGTNQEFSYTDRELTSVEYFFATAIGGGMECAPCLESCKNVNCGPNKKCAKRKGRPKCICAPECGAAVRRRQRMKLFRGATQPHHYHQPQHHHSSESMFSPVQRNLESAVIFGKSARDIRSLSSEIQSQNLGLTVEDGDGEENQSQRKLFIMQSGEVGRVGIGGAGGGQLKSTLKGGSGVEIKQRKRLLIVEARGQQHEDKPTTRRLQVISNTNNNNNHHGNKRKKSTKLHQQNHHEEEVEAKNNRGSSSATTTVALQSTSRHKFNANSNNNNNNGSSNKNMQQTKNFEAKLRHIHQNSRQQLELEADDTPNHHDQQHHGHRRHHQFRKRKKKLHNKLKQDQQQQHDDVENADNATATATTTVVVTMSGTRTITATAAAASSTTSTTPVNSSVTEDQRFLNHGSNVATSSSSRLASSSSSSALSGSGGLTNIGVGGSSSSHHRTLNSDDMTFDDRIYDKFNLHGFPGQEQQKITQIAKSHSSHHPVCGTDGRTYNTECQLKKRACRTDNTELVVAYRGHCKTTCNGVKCLNGLTCVEDHYTIPHCIACKIDCPLDDDDGAIDDDDIDASRAVCGVDGKTYKSVCDINRMICKIGRSIAVAYPGPCRDDRVTCSDINCGPKRTCLMDLLTHEPRCVSCRYKCSRKRRPSSLRYEEGKICGVNNRTYNSWCEMRKDSCGTGFFIDVKSFGECQ